MDSTQVDNRFAIRISREQINEAMAPNVQTSTIKRWVAARQSLCVNEQAKIEQLQ
jgi:hypothetical protein